MTASPAELTIGGHAAREPGPLRLVATLAVAGTLSGLALSGAYTITKPVIDANKARALEAAVLEVVPGSSRILRLVARDGALVPAAAVDAAPTEPSLHAAYDDAGAFLGYAIDGSGAGFQDTIHLICGFDPGRRVVVGMRILQSRETPGLGDKIFKDEDFVANFGALAVDPAIVLVKDGRTADNEVDAITGATISSRAVVKIINAALEDWAAVLPEPGAEPAAPVVQEPDSEEPASGEPGPDEPDAGEGG